MRKTKRTKATQGRGAEAPQAGPSAEHRRQAESLAATIPDALNVRLTPEDKRALALHMVATGEAKSAVIRRLLHGEPAPTAPFMSSLFDAQVATQLEALTKSIRNLGINLNQLTRLWHETHRPPRAEVLLELIKALGLQVGALLRLLRSMAPRVGVAIAPQYVPRRRKGRKPRRPTPLPTPRRSTLPGGDESGGEGGS